MEKIDFEAIATLEAKETAGLDRRDTNRLLGFVTAKLELLKPESADKPDDIDRLAAEIEQFTQQNPHQSEFELAA